MHFVKVTLIFLLGLAVFFGTVGSIMYASTNRSEVTAARAFDDAYEEELRVELASSYSEHECYRDDTTHRCVRIRSLYCQLNVDASVDAMLRCGEAQRIQELTGSDNRELELLQGRDQ